MSRPEKPPRVSLTLETNPISLALFLGLAWWTIETNIGCQFIGGLDELKLASDAGVGGNDTGGSGGNGSSGTNSSSSSSSSSSGVPIMGDIACDTTTCPIGDESACCSDHYHTNSQPWIECVTGPPGADGCKTAAGANGYESRIKCQLPTHCAQGTVCCGDIETVSVLTWYVSLSCTAACNWPDTIACDPMNPMNDCPVVNDNGTMRQTTCTASDLLPTGYFVCQ